MGKVIDLTGKRFGRLTVIAENGVTKHGKILWLCRCNCGNECTVTGNHLKSNHTRSCGCLFIESITKHGMNGNRTYRTWHGMRSRCDNQNHTTFNNYGGRGIGVCSRWITFKNFLADMGKRPEGMTLERIDNDGNYEPSNCKWATQKEQHRNTRHNRMITYQGETKCMAEWAEDVRLKYDTLRNRIDRYGWTIERALTEKVNEG